MKIENATLSPFALPFKGGQTYVSSVAAMSVIPHRLLKVTLSNGTSSVGEISRYPPLNTQETERLEDAALDEIKGMAFADVQTLLKDWRSRGLAMHGIAFALDCVWFDVLSQESGLPVSSLLGGPASGAVPEVLSLSAGSPDQLIDRIQADAGARKTIQIKLGVDDLQQDIEFVRKLLPILRPDQLLLADFNGALPLQSALEELPKLTDPQLLWEEPCRSIKDNLAVSKALGGRLMLDTCLTGLDAVLLAVSSRTSAVAIKPTRLGGLSVAKIACDICSSAGLHIRVDGPWSGQIAAHAALSLAIGVPPNKMIGSIDLTEPLDTERNLICRPKLGYIGTADLRADDSNF